MYSPHKHSYLQSRSSGVNPRIINRSVNLARSKPATDEFDLDPPFLRLCSEQPNVPIQNVDVTRRPLAFGRCALPKLRKDLHHKKASVIIEAINSIMDLVHDPEMGCEAVRLRIPDRMADLLLNGEEVIRERTCMALTVMAELNAGREIICKNEPLLEHLVMLVEDVIPAVRVKAATLIEMLARTWMTADDLVANGFVPVILDNLAREDEEIVAVHLKSLKSLMYGEGKDIALEYSGLDVFVNLMERDNHEILCGALGCIMMLTSIASGKALAYLVDILPQLNRILHDERPEVYTAAASAIMFCTILTKAKIKAAQIQHLPERLLALTKDRHHPYAQIHSIKALTNICEHPRIRHKISEKINVIRNIPVQHFPEIEEYKKTLVTLLQWVPTIST